MNIGIVTTWFERGAAYVSKQYKDIWEKEHNIFIYVRGGEDIAFNSPSWDCDNLTFGKRYNYTKLDLIDLKHFESWIKKSNLNMVFFNEQHIWDPILLCNKLGILTGSYIDYYTEETVDLFSIFDFLICNTQRHYSVFKWHPQVFYFPWGTDLNVFNEKQMKTVNLNILTFFHSAGMNPYRKGTDFLIQAFNNLNHPKAKLLIHSQVDLYKFFPNKRKILDYLIKQQKLEIINKTITSPGLYHKGDVYVYPSRLEGIGLSIAEANACGMPVITTDVAPMNEFIKNRDNGSLIDVSSKKKRRDGYFWDESYININHLQEILEDYCHNIHDLKSRKKRALLYSQERLNWHNNSDGLIEILDNIRILKDKEDAINKIIAYKKSKGFKFFISNMIIYQKIKKRVINLFK